jgi:hypothetical protein
MRRAFVSHSTADDSFVAEMESFLHAAGFDDVFNDVHAIQPDERFWPRIEQGITDCDTFVVVITAAATNSEWVKREVALARRLGKRVIPVWREDCQLPPDFTDRDVIDFRPRTRKERRFDIDRILKYAPAELIGREDDTALLSDALQKTLRLEKGRPHVLTFVALGGEGKTSLVAKWAAELARASKWPLPPTCSSRKPSLSSVTRRWRGARRVHSRRGGGWPSSSVSGGHCSSSTAWSRCNTRPPRPRQANSRTRASLRCSSV